MVLNQTLTFFNLSAMKKLIIFLALLIYILRLYAAEPSLIKAFNKEVAKFYNSKEIQIKKNDELYCNDDFYYHVYNDNKNVGVAVLTSAAGRFDRFDFMVIFNQEMEIEHVKVLKYSSQYGSEITSKRWLKQFYKKQKEDFRYGQDIQAISGATFSAQSLTQKINRIKQNLNHFFND